MSFTLLNARESSWCPLNWDDLSCNWIKQKLMKEEFDPQ